MSEQKFGMHAEEVLYLSLQLYPSKVTEIGFLLLDDAVYWLVDSCVLYQGEIEVLLLLNFVSAVAVSLLGKSR